MESAADTAPVLSRMRDVLHRAVHRMVGPRQAVRLPGAFPVGISAVPLGPVEGAVWYPAALGTQEESQLYSRIYLGLAAPRAPLNCLRQWPLVVLSHGLRGNRFDLSWLAEGLAAHGYIVAAIDHAGSTAADFSVQEGMRLWQRASVLSRAISAVMAHPVFGPYIDRQRVAVAGHSAGGSTALVLAGAQIDRELFTARYPTAGTPNPAADARIRAVIALAPGTGPVFTADGLGHVQTPVMLASGTDDRYTPDREYAGHFARHLPHAVWHRIPHGGHFTFKPVCVQYGHRRTHEISVDHPSIDRVLIHRQIVQWASDFLRANDV